MNKARIRAQIARQTNRSFVLEEVRRKANEFPQVIARFADGTGMRFDILDNQWVCFDSYVGGFVPPFAGGRIAGRVHAHA